MNKNNASLNDFQTGYKDILTKSDEQQICNLQDVNGFQQLNKTEIYDDINQKPDELELIKNNDIYNHYLQLNINILKPSIKNTIIGDKIKTNEPESYTVFSNLPKPSIDTFKALNEMDVFKKIQQDNEK